MELNFENGVLKWVWENTDFMVDWPKELKLAIVQELYGYDKYMEVQ